MKIIITDLEPNTILTLTLDSVEYFMQFLYNDKQDRWYMSLFNNSKEVLVSGIKLIHGVDLLKSYRHLAIPNISLILLNMTNNPLMMPTFDNIKKYFILYYEVL